MIDLKELDTRFKVETDIAIQKIITDNPGITEKEAKDYYEKVLLKDMLNKLENMDKHREKHKEAFDVEEKWGDITGLKEEELNDMPIDELLKLVYSKLKEEISNLSESKTPNNTITLTDKITYSLSAGLIPYRKTQPLKMEKGRTKKQITTFVTLDIDNIEDILPDNIEGEDINLLEAIISLLITNLDEGISTFTLNDIYRVEKKNQSVNPNKRVQDQLKERILKLMKTLITIDSSEEKATYYPDLIYKETSNLLNAHFLEVEIKGNKTIAIKVLDIPLLYRYAQAKKQLTNIPFELTENELIKTGLVLKLEKYLSRRIAQMKNSKTINKNILFSTIYENMNFKQTSESSMRNVKAKARANTEEILKEFMTKGYIKNYHIGKEGRNQYHRLTIEFKE